MRIGAYYKNGACEFTVWAPFAGTVFVDIVSAGTMTRAMARLPFGYWQVVVEGAVPGTRYGYRIDALPLLPDPASFYQPEGPHAPSQVVDHAAFLWEDAAAEPVARDKMILYELHTGTFTPEGTFDAIIPRLEYLHELGVTTLELMPVAQFPGERNWGYDGTCLYAVQNSYGGPDGLKRLVNACHQKGMAVILDVVYNHLGPEGNYLESFGPYLTDKYTTPWGKALNFDGPYNYGLRNHIVVNMLYWFEHFHLDGLRLDAVHGIYDLSAKHILEELAEEAEKLFLSSGRKRYLLAESELNDPRIITSRELGGYGLDAQWNDDFHHSVHALLTGERTGYYQDFTEAGALKKAVTEGFVYDGAYSLHRKRFYGRSSKTLPADHMISSIQNHDQTGNRPCGERLSALTDMEGLKAAAGLLLLTPSIPLLFMGEEYGEEAPFLYFIDYGDKELTEAVRQGRKKDFPHGTETADPASATTFLTSKLDWEKLTMRKHITMFEYYQHLIRLRKNNPSLTNGSRETIAAETSEADMLLWLRFADVSGQLLLAVNLGRREASFTPELPGYDWHLLLDSAAEKWLGPGTICQALVHSRDHIRLRPHSAVLYRAGQGGDL